MKPTQLSRRAMLHESFRVGHQLLPRFMDVWHVHEELELIYIVQSQGTKFVGDSISHFQPGDLVLIGSSLPHLWRNQEDRWDTTAESYSIHIHPHSLGPGFFQKPELLDIRQLMERSRVGLDFKGAERWQIGNAMQELYQASGGRRVLLLLDILLRLAEAREVASLSSPSFLDDYYVHGHSRLDKVYGFILKHFQSDVSLGQVANLVNMNPSAFSRFFKKATQKTFVQYLNEVRIGYARKRLICDPDLNIAEIAYRSGFNNISHFNRQFKRLTGQTPSQFLAQCRQLPNNFDTNQTVHKSTS